MIETEHCTLRVPTSDDLKATIDFYIDNKEHLAPWDPKIPDDFYTAEYWQKKLQDAQNEFENKQSLRLHIFLKENNALIGMINFTGFERGPFQNCRLGYKISRKCEGQGFMTEALGAATEYVFKELNFHRVEANYIPKNERSGRLLKRLGFTEHGIAENYLRIAGSWQEHVLTSLVNEDWRDS